MFKRLFVWAAVAVGSASLSVTATAQDASSTSLPAPPALSVNDAVRRARASAPRRGAAAQRVFAAEAAAASVARMPNPSLELRTENWTTSGAPMPGALDSFVVVSQTVELGGKLGARRRDAGAAVDAARADLQAADWAVGFDVVDRFVGAVRARETRRIVAEHADSLAEIVRVLAERVAEGTAAEADLRRFETEHSRVRYELARAAVALEQELASLSLLVGEPVSAERLEFPALPPAPREPGPATAAVLAQRADIAAARIRAEQLEATAALERSLATPDLVFSGGYKGTSGLRTGVAAATIEIPLFDRNRAAIARASGDARAARAAADYLQQQAAAAVQARWKAARQLLEEASTVDDRLIAPAAVVRSAARARFAESASDILHLVDAERSYAEAAQTALDLRADALLAITRARLSIGEEPLP